jgi:peptidoglycan/xylan/chitin deacetylase (PgdA/CDA1 family)
VPPARLVLFAATAALLGLTGYAVLARPPPLGWAVFALVGYAGLLLGGVLVLPWRVFVDAIVRGPKGARGVVLTFDDGPHPRWTRAVLDILASRGAKATFFVVGRKAEENPDVVRAILGEGHSVGLHSYAHDRLLSLRTERRVRADLERGVAVLAGLLGSRPALFRPPVGHTNPIIARVAEDLDLMVVAWTVRGVDGLPGARPADVAARIARGLRDGAIVLLHDAAERGDREPAAIRALPAILDAIAARGLDVVPLQAWAAARAAVDDPAGSRT